MIKMLPLLLLTCLLLKPSQADLDTLPVFLIDDGALDGVVDSQQNPFVKTGPEEFSAIVENVVRLSNTIIFFIEEQYSMEDIAIKDSIGTAYPFLRQQFLDKKAKILIRVVEPYDLILKRFQEFEFNKFTLRSTASKWDFKEHYKYLYIYFDDTANNTRVNNLRRHDAIMHQVVTSLKRMIQGSVVAFYTGKRNPAKLYEEAKLPKHQKQQLKKQKQTKSKTTSTKPTTTAKPVLLSGEVPDVTEINCYNATFQLFDARAVNGRPSRVTFTPGNCFIYTTDTHTTYDVLLNVEDEPNSMPLTLRFVFSQADMFSYNKGWKLKEITFGQGGKISTSHVKDIVNPWHTWYKSPEQLVMVPDEDGDHDRKLIADYYTILLSKVKPATPFPKRPDTTPAFPYSSYMTQKPRFRVEVLRVDTSVSTLVTIEIIGSLFVSMILILILAWGVQMMMSINTNSKYDDPLTTKPLFNPESAEH